MNPGRDLPSPPPLLIGAGLLFWGWQTGNLLLAAALALVLESARHLPWRWELEARDHYRVADLSSVIFLGIVVYHFADGRFPHALFEVLKWIPAVLFPLMVVQAWSVSGRTRLDALFTTLRRNAEPSRETDLGYPFLGACVLAASAANQEGVVFYGGAVGLAGLALWSARPRRIHAALWAALFATAVGLGWAGAAGLVRLQSQIEDWVLGWMSDHDFLYTDPGRSVTRIGALGRLKASDRILLRVRPEAPAAGPLLLREAVYNGFDGAVWVARSGGFDPLPSGGEAGAWQLSGTAGAGAVEISARLRGGRGVLPLPDGAARLTGLPAEKLERNRLGTVRAEDAPEFVIFRVQLGGTAPEVPPSANDLQTPRTADEALARIAADLRLGEIPPREAVAAVKAFFARDFGYTLATSDAGRRRRSISDFLLKSRAGHCEYFASATVLLLRKAGIPARYAVGYAVREHSWMEDAWLVRSRHAHAWVMAWLDGAWVTVDTTPATWVEVEEDEAPLWQPMYDFGSWLAHRAARWRWAQDEEGVPEWLLWAAVPLGGFLLWSIFRRRRAARVPGHRGGGSARPDSPFYAVMDRLEASDLPREAGETPARWLARMARAGDDLDLESMLRIHYRLRFRPQGTTPGEREELARRARDWLGRRAGGEAVPAGRGHRRSRGGD